MDEACFLTNLLNLNDMRHFIEVLMEQLQQRRSSRKLRRALKDPQLEHAGLS